MGTIMDMIAQAELIYRSEHHEVIERDFGSSTLMVSFTERASPGPADFFGKRFFEKEKLSYISTRTMNNSWYLQDDAEDMLHLMRERIAAYGAQQVILFGFSMASFGCVRSINILKPTRAIVCGPLASLDPSFESRWMSDYAHLMDNYKKAADSILPFRVPVEVIALYDPRDHDAEHVNLLERQSAITRIPVKNAGHHVLQYLKAGRCLGDVTRLLVKPNVDVAQVNRLIAKSRKMNSDHLKNLAEKLNRRPKLQKVVIDHGRKQFPDDHELLMAEAAFLSRQKRLDEARELIIGAAERYGSECISTPTAKAISAYVENGGNLADVEPAVRLFRSSSPRPRGVQLWYSRFLRHAKQWDEAFLAHEQFIKDGDAFGGHAHNERGLILESLGLNCAAHEEFKAAAQFLPNFPQSAAHLRRIEMKIQAHKNKIKV